MEDGTRAEGWELEDSKVQVPMEFDLDHVLSARLG